MMQGDGEGDGHGVGAHWEGLESVSMVVVERNELEEALYSQSILMHLR